MPLNPPVSTWRGRRVWIIGASSGIGAATARLLLAKGARVELSARSREPLEELAGSAPERTLALARDLLACGLDPRRIGGRIVPHYGLHCVGSSGRCWRWADSHPNGAHRDRAWRQ